MDKNLFIMLSAKKFLVLVVFAQFLNSFCLAPMYQLSLDRRTITYREVPEWRVRNVARIKPGLNDDQMRAAGIVREGELWLGGLEQSVWGMPRLGIYLGDTGYPMRSPLFIELDRALASQILPGYTGRARAYIALWTQEIEKFLAPDAQKDTNNVVLHPVLRSWIAQSPTFAYTGGAEYQDSTAQRDSLGTIVRPDHDERRTVRDFGPAVPAGIFNPNHVTVADSLGTNNLGSVPVSFHTDGQMFIRYSPSNAVLKYDSGQQFADFWLVAVSPLADVDETIVVYNIVSLNASGDAAIGSLSQYLQALPKPIDNAMLPALIEDTQLLNLLAPFLNAEKPLPTLPAATEPVKRARAQASGH